MGRRGTWSSGGGHSGGGWTGGGREPAVDGELLVDGEAVGAVAPPCAKVDGFPRG
jgi:hypothetical protein